MSSNKLAIITLILLALLIGVAKFFNSTALTFTSIFESNTLKEIVRKNIGQTPGNFAVYIEQLNDDKNIKYTLNDSVSFPSASLYKLVLLAAVYSEIEEGKLKVEDHISNTQTHLIEILGERDFGYEEAPEIIEYSVQEALERVGRISDNFAAIMLTEKLRSQPCKVSPCEAKYINQESLVGMAKKLGMSQTKFDAHGITTTASDIGHFFKLLHQGQVVSKKASEEIIKTLSLSKIENRIPAKLPAGTRVVHKSGELSSLRHDGGIVYPPSATPYVIVLMSNDLQYEDDGIEVLANISKDVYGYFAKANLSNKDLLRSQ